MKQKLDYIEIVTTCRPCVDQQKFFEFNQIVKQSIQEGCKIKIFNKNSELPINLIDNRNVDIHQDFLGERPTLRCMLENTASRNILICNSDIYFENDFISKLQGLVDKFDRPFCGRRFDVHSKLKYGSIVKADRLKKIGFQQSTRTIDYFLLNKGSIKSLKKVNNLYLGTVGFDVKLLAMLNSDGSLVDVSNYLDVFHPNHEEFREVYKTSFMIDWQGNKDFASERKSKMKLEPNDFIGADLVFCKSKVDKNGLLRPSTKFKLVTYYLQRLQDKISNNCERICYLFNDFLSSFFSSELLQVTISRRYKIVLFLPKNIIKNSKSLQENIEYTVSSNLNNWINEK